MNEEQNNNILLERVKNEFLAFDLGSDDNIVENFPESRTMNPGLGDIQIAQVTQIGHRDRYPRSNDWVNLLPTLEPDEELLWIIHKTDKQHSFYLGLKSFSQNINSRNTIKQRRKRFTMICDGFARRCFPESCLELLDSVETERMLNQLPHSVSPTVLCMTGIPSPKTMDEESLFEKEEENTRSDASLNDVLELLIEEDNFTLIFTLVKATSNDVHERFQTKSFIRDELAPLARQEMNTSHTESKERNLSHTAGTNKGTSYQQARAIGPKIVQLFGGTVDKKKKRKTKIRRVAPNVQSGENQSDTIGQSEGEQDTHGTSYTRVVTYLDFMDKALELSMRHLQQAGGTGGYFGSVMIYANNEAGARRIFQCLSATLSGSHSYVRPMQAVPVKAQPHSFQLTNTTPVHEVIPTVEILNVSQTGRLLLVPDVEIPGVSLKRSVFYGRPQLTSKDNGVVIGEVAFHKPTLIDRVRSHRLGDNDSIRNELKVPHSDLCSHTLLVGTTGSGKTERAVSILNGLDSREFKIIVIETAKKTYRNRLCRDHDPLVYTLGMSTERPFRINPFYFDDGTSLKRHISVLADAITELLPMEALIGPKLREAIERCYSNLGWDIETGTFRSGIPRFPDMIMFNSEVHKICSTLEDYGPEVRANYKGALLNRARIFLDDVYQDIFAFDGNKSFDELFPNDTIIEMEELPPSEINMPGFILSIVLERLRAYQFHKGRENQTKKILIVIEEAHNLLHRKFEQQVDERQSGRGRRLIEQVVRLLQEGRALGIGVMVVDQSAQYLADAVIANTNTKIVHRQEDGKEIEVIGTAIGLKEDDRDDLQRLADGECILKTKQQATPVKLAPLPGNLLSPEHNWDPFADNKICPDFYTVNRSLKKLEIQAIEWDDAVELADRILDHCHNDFALTRFIIGKHAAESGRYDIVEIAARLYTRRNLENLIWRMQLQISQSKNNFYTLLLTGLGMLPSNDLMCNQILQLSAATQDYSWLDEERKNLCTLIKRSLIVGLDKTIVPDEIALPIQFAQFSQELCEWVDNLKVDGNDLTQKLESIRWQTTTHLFQYYVKPILNQYRRRLIVCDVRQVNKLLDDKSQN